MRDIEIISKALHDARDELAPYRDRRPIDLHAIVRRLDQILNHPDVKAAQERLARVSASLRVVK